MADTKQVAPDYEEIALEISAILKKYTALASRSGPDRTPPRSVTCDCGDGGCISCWPSNFTREALIEYVNDLRKLAKATRDEARVTVEAKDEI